MNDKYWVRNSISKILSQNDVGDSGGHQAGILIPKNPDILSFFPDLNENIKNPRIQLYFYDIEGKKWIFNFIYYNNRLFGGTRNEYRLTAMTTFIKNNNLKAGDEIIFFKNDNGLLQIRYRRAFEQKKISEGVIRLGNDWKVINI